MLRCRGLKPPVNKVSSLRDFIKSPVRGDTLLTVGFNLRIEATAKIKSPVRDDTLFNRGI